MNTPVRTGPMVVSVFLKFLAVAAIPVGAYIAFRVDQAFSDQPGRFFFEIEAGVIAGTMFVASALAFMAYVLDLLGAVDVNTWLQLPDDSPRV